MEGKPDLLSSVGDNSNPLLNLSEQQNIRREHESVDDFEHLESDSSPIKEASAPQTQDFRHAFADDGFKSQAQSDLGDLDFFLTGSTPAPSVPSPSAPPPQSVQDTLDFLMHESGPGPAIQPAAFTKPSTGREEYDSGDDDDEDESPPSSVQVAPKPAPIPAPVLEPIPAPIPAPVLEPTPAPNPDFVMKPKANPSAPPAPSAPVREPSPTPPPVPPHAPTAFSTPSAPASQPAVLKPTQPPPPIPKASPKAPQTPPPKVGSDEICCPFSLVAWLQKGRLPQQVEALVYWRDPKKSGVVFGSILVVLISLSLCSLISVVANLSLFALIAVLLFRGYKCVMQMIQKTPDGHPFKELLEVDITLQQDKVRETTDLAVTHVNATILELRRLFLIEDLVDSLKFGGVLWILSYVGSWFNGMTLVIIAFVALFTLPKVYESNQAQIDQNVAIVRSKITEITNKVKAAIPIGNKGAPEKKDQ